MDKANRKELFMHMSGVLKKKKCHLYQINGVEDHLHILTHIHPMVAPSMLVKDIKLASTELIKSKNLFYGFEGWQEGYGAFTYAQDSKKELIQYVMNQEEHHKKETSRDEYIRLLDEHGIAYDLKYII